MSFYLRYTLSVTLLGISLMNASPFFEDYEDELVEKRYAEFHCYKFKGCTPGPPKVCGYNMRMRELAEFEDKCTFHKANCKGGYFQLVSMDLCTSHKESHFNASFFEWEHLNRTLRKTTTESALPWNHLVPSLVKLVVNKFL